MFISLFLFFKSSISDFLQSTAADFSLTSLCVLVWFVCVSLSCGKQRQERERMYIATLWGHPSSLLSEGLRVSTTAFIFLPAI